MLKEVLVLVGVCFHTPGDLGIGGATQRHCGLQKHNLGNYRLPQSLMVSANPDSSGILKDSHSFWSKRFLYKVGCSRSG